MNPRGPTYFLTRFLLMRLLGFVYFIAFLSLTLQLRSLIGEHGLTPAFLFLSRVQNATGSLGKALWELPSLFWFNDSDVFMTALAGIGTGLSFFVFLGFSNGLLMSLLWVLYLSFVHIGQDWYSYGWEIQLLETGFLSIFFVPYWDPRPFSNKAPPIQVLWLYRWLIFRVMLGAGLIKIRGDSCWRDLTCLVYHYETQPLPNPISPYFHFMPLWFHKCGCLFNFLVELGAPWLMILGRRWRTLSGCLMAALQILLILSGNLSFLNWLTLVPIVACFDDDFWRKFLPLKTFSRMENTPTPRFQQKAAWVLTLMVGFLSIQPVLNLVSPEQAMNTSFDRLDLVNTYGAFGTVGRERMQLVIEGTTEPDPKTERDWKPYLYKAQPVELDRRPVFCAPYQYRLDWQIWFAAMSEPSEYPWVFHLTWMLLHNDPLALDLFQQNPFPSGPPRFVRFRLFRYQLTPLDHKGGLWWTRKELGLWIPPLSVDNPQLNRILGVYGWR